MEKVVDLHESLYCAAFRNVESLALAAHVDPVPASEEALIRSRAAADPAVVAHGIDQAENLNRRRSPALSKVARNPVSRSSTAICPASCSSTAAERGRLASTRKCTGVAQVGKG